jgi:hypothetical protein
LGVVATKFLCPNEFGVLYATKFLCPNEFGVLYATKFLCPNEFGVLSPPQALYVQEKLPEYLGSFNTKYILLSEMLNFYLFI